MLRNGLSLALLALLLLLTPACDGCEASRADLSAPRPAPGFGDAGGQAPHGEAVTNPADETRAAPTADASAEALGALLPPRPGMPRVPPGIVLGTTPIADVDPRSVTGAGAPLEGAPLAARVRSSARAERFPSRADRVNELALSVELPLEAVRGWLEARWGAPLEAPDDSGVVFRGGPARATYWFDAEAGLRIKLLARGPDSVLSWSRFAPLEVLLGRGGVVELLGASVDVLRERYGRDLVVVPGGETVLYLAPIELGLEPVVVRWPSVEPGAPVRGPLDVEIPHGPSPGPFDAEAVLAALGETLGPLEAPEQAAAPVSVGRIRLAERTVDVWRLPVQSRIRLRVQAR